MAQRPAAVPREELEVLLRDMAHCVANRDTFEGSISYSLPEPIISQREYDALPDEQKLWYQPHAPAGEYVADSAEFPPMGHDYEITPQAIQENYMVTGSYRHGNLEGQGFVRIIGKIDTDPVEREILKPRYVKRDPDHGLCVRCPVSGCGFVWELPALSEPGDRHHVEADEMFTRHVALEHDGDVTRQMLLEHFGIPEDDSPEARAERAAKLLESALRGEEGRSNIWDGWDYCTHALAILADGETARAASLEQFKLSNRSQTEEERRRLVAEVALALQVVRDCDTDLPLFADGIVSRVLGEKDEI